MYKVNEKFKGVLSFGRELFKAGQEIPEAKAKKMDLESLIKDGVVVGDIDLKKSESTENITLEEMSQKQLLVVANDEMELGIPVRTSKQEVYDAIIKAKAQETQD